MTATHLNTAPQLTGSTLTLRALFTPTSGCPPIADTALARVEAAHQQLLTARDTGDVYGANTGVGANRAVQVGDTAGTSHGLRLLRSHCAGFGPTEDDDTVRAAMLIRLNQMLAGGAGVSPGFVTGLADALTADALPTLHRYGSIGTADLSPLAELALTLIGERPWKTGTLGPVPLGESDALPFISSSAITIATAARAVLHTQQLLQAAETVTALTFLALGGARQAWNPRVHAARAHPHQLEVAQRLTQLVHTEADPPPARLQDPYGLRIVPQVHAPALSALDTLASTVEREMNSATENPLVVDNGVLHHGQFHLATLAAHLDHARTTLLPNADPLRKPTVPTYDAEPDRAHTVPFRRHARQFRTHDHRIRGPGRPSPGPRTGRPGQRTQREHLPRPRGTRQLRQPSRPPPARHAPPSASHIRGRGPRSSPRAPHGTRPAPGLPRRQEL